MNDERPFDPTPPTAATIVSVLKQCEAFVLEKGDPYDGDDWQLMQDIREAIKQTESAQV